MSESTLLFLIATVQHVPNIPTTALRRQKKTKIKVLLDFLFFLEQCVNKNL